MRFATALCAGVLLGVCSGAWAQNNPAANQAAIVFRKLFDEVAQLNDGHKFSYDRDALVKMLDDALARAKAPR